MKVNDMERTPGFDRRTVLRGAGTIALAGVLAGCGGGDGGGGEGGDGGGDGGDGGDGGMTDTPTPTSTPTPSGGDGGGGGGAPSDVQEYLSDVGNFDGVQDMTGNSEVTVQVGVEANGGSFGFGPAAIRVDTGTTVVWEWTGKGGQHNVVAESGAFESKLVGNEGHTFEQTFDSSGNVLYFCRPHKGLGMKGAVIVG